MNLFLPRDYSAVRARVTEAFTLRRLSAKIIGEIGIHHHPDRGHRQRHGGRRCYRNPAARSLCGAANGWMARISTPSMSLSLSLNMSARGSLSPQAQAVKEILLSLVSRPSLENRELQLVS
ncbi:nitrogen assimilation transcriptional regulator [Klebsiella pneumoniae]|nr:nitrogen assimilation transcriptional regulator [Klebsiella pneumoniae]